MSSGSPQSLRIDSEGECAALAAPELLSVSLPHMSQGSPTSSRAPGGLLCLANPSRRQTSRRYSSASTLLLGERELVRVGVGGGGGLDKAAAEKLIRGAEEEQEKVTLQLLHRLEELNREKANVANVLEQESEQVVHKLLGTHRGADAFVGPTLAAATSGAKSAPLSSQARTHGPALIQTLSIDETFHRLDQQRHQRTQSYTRPTVTSAPWVESSQLGTPSRTTTRHIAEPASHSGAATGKPHLLVDYLGHALEEAQALEDRLHILEAWMAEVHHLAEKFRNEVIELRDKVCWRCRGSAERR